jgi:hypothetical protein
VISAEEIRGAIILLMRIDQNVERIANEVAQDDGEEEEEQG